jgi:hypothetical protein
MRSRGMVCEKEQVYMRYCITEDKKRATRFGRENDDVRLTPAKELAADGGMRGFLLAIMNGEEMKYKSWHWLISLSSTRVGEIGMASLACGPWE